LVSNTNNRLYEQWCNSIYTPKKLIGTINGNIFNRTVASLGGVVQKAEAKVINMFSSRTLSAVA
jgi:hypothetical protein